MADEAFALSPISARASQPREEDYEAISAAFMETSRGRWFLGEYARRNRNADTRMVLDAVARIEENLAAQKQPAADNGLAEAVVAIRSAVDEARASALVALDGLALEPSLAPVRKGARVIREISWRLREIGADGRICDLIDSQISAIEAGCGQISSADARSGLGAAFDLLERRIEAFDDDGTTRAFSSEVDTGSHEENASNKNKKVELPEAEEAVPPSSPAPPDEAPAAAVETAPPASAANEPEAAATNISVSSDEAVVAAPEVADVPADLADAHDADAHEEAVLDMVAFEMAAPDPSDIDDAVYIDPACANPADTDARVAGPPPVEPQTIAPAPELAVPPVAPVVVQPSLESSLAQPSFERPVAPSLEPSREPSLGATLIANGIVRRRRALTPDPLAPIRRMSQAEKIALFS